MEPDIYTVEQAAQYLRLHPKTVLRLIREERIRATRIGKAYRIARADLEAFAGVPESAAPTSRTARTTSIVDIDGLTVAQSSRIATALQAALLGGGRDGRPMQFTTAYDEAARRLKLVLIGAPGDTAALLDFLENLLEDAR